MKELTLEFKEKDFQETSFTDYKDCAITRALNRRGIPAVHTGCAIVAANNQPLFIDSTSNLSELTYKVADAYMGMSGRNFTFTIKKNELWY